MLPIIETTHIGVFKPQKIPASFIVDLLEDAFSCHSVSDLAYKNQNAGSVSYEKDRSDEAFSCEITPEACEETKDRWCALKIRKKRHVPLDIVLTRLMQPLYACGLEILIASGKESEYIMVRENDLPRAIDILRIAGHRVQTLVQKEQTSYGFKSRSPLQKEQKENKKAMFLQQQNFNTFMSLINYVRIK